MRTQRALFLSSVMSVVAFGLFISRSAYAQPSTGSQSTRLHLLGNAQHFQGQMLLQFSIECKYLDG